MGNGLRRRGLGGLRFAALFWAVAQPGCQDAAPPEAPTEAPAPAPASPASPASAAIKLAEFTPAPARLDLTALAAAEALCADCHPDEVSAWRASPMGRSLGPTAQGSGFANHLKWLSTVSPGVATHPAGAPTFVAQIGLDGSLRFGERSPTHSVERPASYAIGSGAHTRSFLWADVEGALWLAPLTWYRRLGQWDLSPGYHHADQPGLFRPINQACLSCHADAPTPVLAGARPAPPTAIGCARCHGDARAHAEARARGTDAPVVNPARLEPDLSRAVCEQCHLQGEVRLVLEGHTAADFVPGLPLGSVFAVFERETAEAGFGIASHGARLRRSRCAEADGAPLTCVACHRPHAAKPTARAAACASCHGAGDAKMLKQCTKSLDTPTEFDCVTCHMSSGATDDIPHVALTDHWIRRRPGEAGVGSVAEVQAPSPLRLLGAPAGAHTDLDLLLGRAYAQAARDHGHAADLSRAETHLAKGLAADAQSAAGWRAKALTSRTAGDLPAALEAIVRAAQLAPGDADIALEWGEIALRAGQPEVALTASTAARPASTNVFEFNVLSALSLAAIGQFEAANQAAIRATTLRPGAAGAWMAAATVARAAGDVEAALAALKTANVRAPAHRSAWLQRARLLRESARWAEALAVLDAALNHLDLSLASANAVQATADRTGPGQRRLILAAQARLAAERGDLAAARGHLRAVLSTDPGASSPPPPPPDALVALAMVAHAAGDHTAAIPALQAVVTADPSDGPAFSRLAEVLARVGNVGAAAAARRQAEGLRIPSPAPLVPGASGRP